MLNDVCLGSFMIFTNDCTIYYNHIWVAIANEAILTFQASVTFNGMHVTSIQEQWGQLHLPRGPCTEKWSWSPSGFSSHRIKPLLSSLWGPEASVILSFLSNSSVGHPPSFLHPYCVLVSLSPIWHSLSPQSILSNKYILLPNGSEIKDNLLEENEIVL